MKYKVVVETVHHYRKGIWVEAESVVAAAKMAHEQVKTVSDWGEPVDNETFIIEIDEVKPEQKKPEQKKG